MKVYLLRHAKTEDSENSLGQRDDTPIVVDTETLAKVDQAKKKLGKVHKIYCSPLSRAKQTADLVFGINKYVVLDYIYEYKTPAELVGKPKEIAVDYWEVKNKKRKFKMHWTPEGGESLMSVRNRAESLYKYLFSIYGKSQKVAVVGHGTFFRHFLLNLANIPDRYGNKLNTHLYPSLFFEAMRKLKWDYLEVVEVEL
jgi:broad specificity phosphatase PhoE